MTDEQIIKALKCCGRNGTSATYCCDCAYTDYEDCGARQSKDALNLINRQKEEIEEQHRKIEFLQSSKDLNQAEFAEVKAELELKKAEIERLKKEKDSLIKTYKECMTEAIKKFAEKFKKKAGSIVTRCQGYEIYETKQYQISAVNFDNLVKEIEGGTDE